METSIATLQSAKMADDILNEFARLGKLRVTDTRHGSPVISGTLDGKTISYLARRHGPREYEIIRIG